MHLWQRMRRNYAHCPSRWRSISYSFTVFRIMFLATMSLLGVIRAIPAQAATNQAIWPIVRLTLVVDGLVQPVNMISANDGANRLFVLERRGVIHIIQDGQLLATPFLNLTDRVKGGADCGECGLLGLAFPPDFAENGYFFVNYTHQENLVGPDTGDPDGDFDTVVARFRITANPNVADPDSEERILRINQPNTNHNGGHIAFGPDNYLYIGMGDGGGGGDPHNNSQDPQSLHGKILRIEVSASGTYTIPATNPFTTTADYRPEIWATGLRNPWRFSFDRVTGDLYVADVGQSGFEEVNYIAAAEIGNGGMNFGWPIIEGNACYPLSGPQDCDRSGLTAPVLTYNQADGDCSITGGYVHRSNLPDQPPIYLYGDFCSGRMWGAQPVGDEWSSQLLRELGFRITSFGQGEDGTVYVVNYAGEIYRVDELEGKLFLPVLITAATEE